MDDLPPIIEKVREGDLSKLRSAELRQAASDADRASQVVIVELDLPLGRLVRSEVRAGRGGIGRQRIRLEPPPEGSPDPASIVAETAASIARILGKRPPSYLSTSQSFIVEADGEQLARIASLPAVLAIWPNTRRRVGY